MTSVALPTLKDEAGSGSATKRSFADLAEQAWIWSIVGYSVLRFVVAWGAFSEHGANIWIFGLIDVGTAWPYAKSVAVVARKAADGNYRALPLPLVVAVATFFAPYAYLWFAAGEMPDGVRFGMVLCVSVLLLAATAGVLSKAKKLRAEQRTLDLRADGTTVLAATGQAGASRYRRRRDRPAQQRSASRNANPSATKDTCVRALLSVSDKSGLVPFAEGLVALGYELVSSGGTHAALTEAGVPARKVSEVTGADEMLDGRVKTLHPVIHGGILANRDEPSHMEQLADRDIAPIDVVVVNLYPFVAAPGIENIDIGGPTMVRSAAKNHDSVAVIVDPGDYDDVLAEMQAAPLGPQRRRALARKAFAHTAAYDAAITTWLDETDTERADDALPASLHLSLDRVHDLRYGENPHQAGARYRFTHGSGWWDSAVIHQGKEMSYLNVYDTEAAWNLVNSLHADGPAVVVMKHANPCGAALGETIEQAYTRAHEGDTVSAFGGIVAANRPVNVAMAEALAPVFTEVIVAPSFDQAALDVLAAKKNLRVVEVGDTTWAPLPLTMRSISGGLLVQHDDTLQPDTSEWRVVTERTPTDAEMADLVFAWRVGARVTSNTIVLVKDGQAVGIGAGQQNRRDAGQIAAEKAAGRAVGGACASDAFFPFRDGLDAAASAGATAVVQPGGSIRDDEVIAAANEQGMAMVFTGRRHFKH
ncbi:Bifunctional purine biosynthesis protein PurH [Nymphon striatum]|nr:Bifunctional purine biosynthesis protein PurH [Nymphon striatum]